jgi:hypothetical protein
MQYRITHKIAHTVRDTVRQAKKDGAAFARYPVLMLEPVVGLEPTTYCLQDSCSTN